MNGELGASKSCTFLSSFLHAGRMADSSHPYVRQGSLSSPREDPQGWFFLPRTSHPEQGFQRLPALSIRAGCCCFCPHSLLTASWCSLFFQFGCSIRCYGKAPLAVPVCALSPTAIFPRKRRALLLLLSAAAAKENAQIQERGVVLYIGQIHLQGILVFEGTKAAAACCLVLRLVFHWLPTNR